MTEESKVVLANPGPVGLVAFGLTTLILSLINAGVLPEGGLQVVLPLALAFGGLIQIIAGLMEFRIGNPFGMTAFLSFGAFWWWFALLLILGKNGVLDLSKAGDTIPATMLAWGLFTFYMWIVTFKMAKALWWVFLTLWITYALLGFGLLFAIIPVYVIGGWTGVLTGLIALYTSFGMVINDTWGKPVIPLGLRSDATENPS